jgi:hypothetical protein
MPFIDVGTTARKRMTETRALKAWERCKGVCVVCGLPIDGTRADWYVEHIRALELGGEDVESNLGPAHWACKRGKDAEDHSKASKAKRSKRRELGITQALKKAPPLKSRGFAKAAPQARATAPLTKPLPPRRDIYERTER